ncbi:MAG: hypothetical protein AAFQ41_00330 [Cyanobacteria bacterium J06623_7]
MEQYLSAAQVAKIVGVHYRTIENWAAQEHLERDNGKYGLLSAFAYRIEQLKDELNEIKDNPNQELKFQKLKHEVLEREAIARIKTLEADRLEGKLVDSEEVLEQWRGAIAKVKAKFISLPAKLALELSGLNKPEDIQARLTQVIDEALIELGTSN